MKIKLKRLFVVERKCQIAILQCNGHQTWAVGKPCFQLWCLLDQSASHPRHVLDSIQCAVLVGHDAKQFKKSVSNEVRHETVPGMEQYKSNI